jgi:hypothetical protein
MSTKSVAEKLQIKPNGTVWSSHPDRDPIIEPLPRGVQRTKKLGEASVAVIFADDEESLRKIIKNHKDTLSEPGILWVAYPKANRTDINRDTLWPILAEHSLRPVTQVSLDDIWSALRFRPLKEGEAQFTGGR